MQYVARKVPVAADGAWQGGLLAFAGLAFGLAATATTAGRCAIGGRAREGHRARGCVGLGNASREAATTTATKLWGITPTATATVTTRTLNGVRMLIANA